MVVGLEDGFAVDGLAEDGLAEDGLAEDGLAEDGLAEDGLAEDGLALEGLLDGLDVGADEGLDDTYELNLVTKLLFKDAAHTLPDASTATLCTGAPASKVSNRSPLESIWLMLPS